MDAATYQRARAEGMPALHALRLARWIAEPKLDIQPDRPLHIEHDGFDVTILARTDEYADTSDLYGTFETGTEDWRTGYWHADTPGAIPVNDGDTRRPSGGRGFYVPSEPLSAHVKEYQRMGQSRSVALDNAREVIADELARANDDYGPNMLVLTVTASREGIELGSASVGGIEVAWSDITRTSGYEYLSEVAEDIIPEAIADARDALTRLAVPA